jgi:hypothetical protein
MFTFLCSILEVHIYVAKMLLKPFEHGYYLLLLTLQRVITKLLACLSNGGSA